MEIGAKFPGEVCLTDQGHKGHSASWFEPGASAKDAAFDVSRQVGRVAQDLDRRTSESELATERARRDIVVQDERNTREVMLQAAHNLRLVLEDGQKTREAVHAVEHRALERNLDNAKEVIRELQARLQFPPTL